MVHKADAVGHIQSLRFGFFLYEVHKDDLLTDSGCRKGIGAMAAHMSGSDDNDFSVFHSTFLLDQVMDQLRWKWAKPFVK